MRPDTELLPTLALCVATGSLSYYVENDRRVPAKSLDIRIGILMRWGYTEKAIADLESITASKDAVLTKGAQLLASRLRQVQLPEKIKPKKPKVPWKWNSTPSIQIIRERKSLFLQEQPKSSLFDLGNLACRIDLPDILEQDRQRMKEIVANICQNLESVRGMGNRRAHCNRIHYGPWLAKYFPDEHANNILLLRLKALDYEKPYHILRFLVGSMHSEGKPSKIFVDKVHELAQKIMKGSEEEHPATWSILTELILLFASETDQLRWFKLVGQSASLRASAMYEPNGELIAYLLTAAVIDYAWSRIRAIEPTQNSSTSKKEASEFEFWCWVLVSSRKQNEEIHSWTKTQIKRIDRDARERYVLFNLFAVSGTETWLEDILEDQYLRHELDDSAVRALFRSEANIPESISLSGSYEEYMEMLPQGLVSSIFQSSGREEDFDRWASELIKLVLELAGGKTQNADCEEKRLLKLNDQGIVEASEDNSEVDGTDRIFVDCWKGFVIKNFIAHWVLRKWAQNNNKAFISFAADYLEKHSQNASAIFNMGVFADAVLCTLLQYEPRRAYKELGLSGKRWMKTNVPTPWGAPNFVAVLWDSELCKTQVHAEVRKQLFKEAKTDKEIMLYTVTALAKNREEELLDNILSEFLDSALGKDRCLAVSILSWLGDEDAIQILTNLKENDRSYWVRDHAAWGYEVAQQERSCRQLYRKVLRESNPIQVSAILQQIELALTPTAKWWRRKIEQEEKDNRINDRRLDALLYSFWHHWDAPVKTRTEVFGRKLEEYCRGEKLDSYDTRDMSPWWELSE